MSLKKSQRFVRVRLMRRWHHGISCAFLLLAALPVLICCQDGRAPPGSTRSRCTDYLSSDPSSSNPCALLDQDATNANPACRPLIGLVITDWPKTTTRADFDQGRVQLLIQMRNLTQETLWVPKVRIPEVLDLHAMTSTGRLLVLAPEVLPRNDRVNRQVTA